MSDGSRPVPIGSYVAQALADIFGLKTARVVRFVDVAEPGSFEDKLNGAIYERAMADGKTKNDRMVLAVNAFGSIAGPDDSMALSEETGMPVFTTPESLLPLVIAKMRELRPEGLDLPGVDP